MNILTELLPGARQLRAPLAIGYLWLVAAWINFPRFPNHLRHGVLLLRASQDAKDMTPVLLIIIVSFAAYLVGLVMQALWDTISRTVAYMAGVLIFGVVAIICIIVLIRIWIIIPLSAVAFMFYAALQWWRHKRIIQPKLLDRAVVITAMLMDKVSAFKTLIKRIGLAASAAEDKLVADKLALFLGEHPDIQSEFCITLSPISLQKACRAAGLYSGNASTKTPDGKIIEASEAARHIVSDEAYDSALRFYLAQRMETSREICGAVALRVMDNADVRRIIEHGLENAQSWLRAEKPSVFEACDRLRSESEFRRGVSVPLAVVVCSVIALYSRNYFLILSPIIAISLLYLSGLRKLEEAETIIVTSGEAGIVSVNLNVTDARQLSWHTGERNVGPEIKEMRWWKRVSAYPQSRRYINLKSLDTPNSRQA